GGDGGTGSISWVSSRTSSCTGSCTAKGAGAGSAAAGGGEAAASAGGGFSGPSSEIILRIEARISSIVGSCWGFDIAAPQMAHPGPGGGYHQVKDRGGAGAKIALRIMARPGKARRRSRPLCEILPGLGHRHRNRGACPPGPSPSGTTRPGTAHP